MWRANPDGAVSRVMKSVYSRTDLVSRSSTDGMLKVFSETDVLTWPIFPVAPVSYDLKSKIMSYFVERDLTVSGAVHNRNPKMSLLFFWQTQILCKLGFISNRRVTRLDVQE